MALKLCLVNIDKMKYNVRGDYMKDFIKDILSFFVFLKYKNIWNIKNKLVAEKKESGVLATVYDHYIHKEGGYVGIRAKFANKPYMPHGFMGVFISDMTEIGKNAVIFQHVTIGADRLLDSNNQGNPKIGDNVYIGAGAKIIGNVTIGNNCRIGANAVVYMDMPDNSVAVASPTRIIQKENLDNRFVVANKDGTLRVYEDGVFHALKK